MPGQLIVSLERRLIELGETLEKVRDDFLDKSADLEVLQKKANDQVGGGWCVWVGGGGHVGHAPEAVCPQR